MGHTLGALPVLFASVSATSGVTAFASASPLGKKIPVQAGLSILTSSLGSNAPVQAGLEAKASDTFLAVASRSAFTCEPYTKASALTLYPRLEHRLPSFAFMGSSILTSGLGPYSPAQAGLEAKPFDGLLAAASRSAPTCLAHAFVRLRHNGDGQPRPGQMSMTVRM